MLFALCGTVYVKEKDLVVKLIIVVVNYVVHLQKSSLVNEDYIVLIIIIKLD